MGGRDQYGLTDSHDVFDDRTGKWSRLTACPVRRQGAAAIAVDSRIYLLGGSGSSHDGAMITGIDCLLHALIPHLTCVDGVNR